MNSIWQKKDVSRTQSIASQIFTAQSSSRGKQSSKLMKETMSFADDKSVTSGMSSSGTHSFMDSSTRSSSTPERVYNAPVVAKSEEKAILRSKILVGIVLLLAAVVFAVATNLNMRQREQEEFESQFEGYASEIIAVARQKADHLFSAMDTMSVVIASQARESAATSNTSWPFITIPDWSLKTKKLTELIEALDAETAFAPIVEEDQKDEWEAFSRREIGAYYHDAINQEMLNSTVQEMLNKTIPKVYFYDFQNNWLPTPVSEPGPVIPVWQAYPLGADPLTGLTLTNYDLLHVPRTSDLYYTTKAVLGPTIGFTQVHTVEGTIYAESQIVQPIFEGVDTDAEDRKIVAIQVLRINWLGYFRNLLPETVEGVVVVLRSSCPIVDVFAEEVVTDKLGTISYLLNGPDVESLGDVDAHDPNYDSLGVSDVFVDLHIDESKVPAGKCVPTLTLSVYPSTTLEDQYHTTTPAIYTGGVLLIFAFTGMVLYLYDYFVGQRQMKVMNRIIKQDLIVSNVFPSEIRDRLFGQEDDGSLGDDDVLDPLGMGDQSHKGAPLADLFPNTTVVFADMAGFTAWSSAREPQQVFLLLESIYGAFDKIALRRGVFKVETVGDCYVAVAGLPEPSNDHAVAVCKFARDCLVTMKEMTMKLEVSLGPDTGDLDLRIGIHSGQVTAGVLRGERSRFQLFGDTMNTAARMESSGERSRIHLSQATADLLTAAGHSKMIKPREEKVFVKGKGDMQTYWLRTDKAKMRRVAGSKAKGTNLPSLDEATEADDSLSGDSTSHLGINHLDLEGAEGMTKTERLVEWNVEVLTSLLQQIIASRDTHVSSIESLSSVERELGTGDTVLEEFVPIISLERCKADDLKHRRRPSSIDIGNEAKSQLRNFLSTVASMYKDNAFHNFEHASHVTASVKKLLKRIVNVDNGNGLQSSSEAIDLIDLAGHSYGITSDPLTQFAVVFSAIIHDLDHPGVPNTQLVKEKTRNAQIYKKSIAEQNSVDLTWQMLMGDEYQALRACIYQNEKELKRFRQLVVNTVMATDIADKELQALRKARWETAFSGTLTDDHMVHSQDRKATIVIEHLIQASDVSHTMQHWQIYKQWNEKFFHECYGAYKAGRAETDPSENWYKGEIGFFDFYVIPLAKKLDSCGVFGVSSHEYLNYATANRDEWIREGESLVQEYLSKYKSDDV